MQYSIGEPFGVGAEIGLQKICSNEFNNQSNNPIFSSLSNMKNRRYIVRGIQCVKNDLSSPTLDIYPSFHCTTTTCFSGAEIERTTCTHVFSAIDVLASKVQKPTFIKFDKIQHGLLQPLSQELCRKVLVISNYMMSHFEPSMNSSLLEALSV